MQITPPNVNFDHPHDALEDSARDVDDLIIYDKEAPHDWDFDTMNRKPSGIRRGRRESTRAKARQAQSIRRISPEPHGHVS